MPLMTENWAGEPGGLVSSTLMVGSGRSPICDAEGEGVAAGGEVAGDLFVGFEGLGVEPSLRRLGGVDVDGDRAGFADFDFALEVKDGRALLGEFGERQVAADHAVGGVPVVGRGVEHVFAEILDVGDFAGEFGGGIF